METRFSLGALAGALVLINLNLLPWSAVSPRGTDAIGLLLLIGLIWKYQKGNKETRLALRYGLLAAIPGVWLGVAVVLSDWQTVFRGLRWLTGLAWGIVLYQLALCKEGRAGIAVGLILGALGNTAVLAFQIAGFTDVLTTVGVVPSDAARRFVNGRPRYAGIGGMSNATMAMVSMGIPASLYLTFAERKSMLWVLAAGLGLLTATWMTYTRSPIVVSGITVCIWLISRVTFDNHTLRVPRRVIQFAGALAVSGTSLIVLVGPPGGWHRWTNISRIHENLAVRYATTIRSMETAFAHPFGYGAGNPGIPSTHNAFSQAMIEFGVLFGLLITALIGVTAIAVWTSRNKFHDLAAIVAIQLVGVFFFEMHLNNPTFIILSSWILITGFDLVGSGINVQQTTSIT